MSLRSPRIPGLLAYLLLFAGLAYMLIHSLQNFTGLSDELVAMLEKILMAPMALAEILLAFWLIIRGGKRR